MNQTDELTDRQLTIFSWIREECQLPVIADAYAGAAICLKNKTPGFVTITAHAGREIVNRLAADFREEKSDFVQYRSIVERLSKAWKRGLELHASNVSSESAEIRESTMRSLAIIEELIQAHDEGNARAEGREALFFTVFLNYESAGDIPPHHFGNFRTAKKWFDSYAHCRAGKFVDSIAEDADHHFAALENMLEAAARQQQERMSEIYGFLAEANQKTG